MNDPNLVVEPQIGLILAEKMFCGWVVVFSLIVSVGIGALILTLYITHRLVILASRSYSDSCQQLKAHAAIDLSCILFIKFHVNQESHSGSRGIALRSEGKNLKKTETVNRMKGVCIDDENAVKVRKI